MSETVDKVICCDRGNNNDALLASIIANNNRRNDDPMAMAAMMGGGFGANQWMNNPFAYMMMMGMMRMFGFGGWGNGEGYGYGQGQQNVEMQNQLQAIRTQLQDNQNSGLIMGAIQNNSADQVRLADRLGVSIDFLKECCCQVRSQIQEVAGQVGFSAERVINAANMGDCRIIEALKDCCCQNKELVQRMGYENQLGLKDLGYTMRDGFCGLSRETQFGFDRTNTAIERLGSALGFQGQTDKCDIINTITASQQKTADLLNAHWSQQQADKIQDLKFEVSQLKQTQNFSEQIRAAVEAAVNACGCRKPCGCNNTSRF